MRQIGRILLLSLLAAPVWALDLGEFVRSSYLGEPLRAQIALTGAQPDELTGLTVELADEETYRARGMVRPWLGTPLRMELAYDLGKPVLFVETDTPPQLAHADLILAVRWSGGQIHKHYGLTLGEGWKAAEILPLPPLAAMRPSSWPVAVSKPEPLVKRPPQAPTQLAAVASQPVPQLVQPPVQQPAPPAVVVNPIPTPAPTPAPTPIAEALSAAPVAPVAVQATPEAVVPEAESPGVSREPRAESPEETPSPLSALRSPLSTQVPKPQSAGQGRVTAAKVEAKAPAGKPRLRLSQPVAPQPVAAPAAAPVTAKTAPADAAREIASLEEVAVALTRQLEEANARVQQLDAAATDLKALLALQARQSQAKPAEAPKTGIVLPKLRALERLLGQGQGLLAVIIAAVVIVTAWLLYRSGRRVRRLAARFGPAGPAAPASPAPSASRPALNLKAANDARAAYATGATAPAAPLDLGGFSLDLKTDPAVAARPQRLPSGLMV